MSIVDYIRAKKESFKAAQEVRQQARIKEYATKTEEIREARERAELEARTIKEYHAEQFRIKEAKKAALKERLSPFANAASKFGIEKQNGSYAEKVAKRNLSGGNTFGLSGLKSESLQPSKKNIWNGTAQPPKWVSSSPGWISGEPRKERKERKGKTIVIKVE